MSRKLSRISSILVQLLLALSSAAVFAAELSPVGAWKTIDDQTGKPRGLVRITEVNGQYQGKIEKTFPLPGEIPIRSATSAAVRGAINRWWEW